MSDSGDSDVSWVFYKDRPDWSDVTPVPEDFGPTPVVVIAYSEKFQDVYDYFRAVLKANEVSERALHLTKDAVELNPANYTVWQYSLRSMKGYNISQPAVEQSCGLSSNPSPTWRKRPMPSSGMLQPDLRDLLQALGTDLKSELEYVDSVIKASPKNYQVWNHRRVLIEWLQDPSLELEVTANALQQDPKNYHAWQHRQWAIKTFGLFDKEMDFVDHLINEDVRNNSAWNQRYFVMNNHVGWSDFNVQQEICYTLEKIKIVKNNESAWNYLRGVLLHDKLGVSGNEVVTSFCEDLYNTRCRSPYLLAFIIDICEESLRKGNSSCLYNSERAIELCKELATKHDKIRSKYWNFFSEKIKILQNNIKNYQENNIV